MVLFACLNIPNRRMKCRFWLPRLSRIKPSPDPGRCRQGESPESCREGCIGSGGLGEPDFDTPDFIKDAATAAMKAGQTKYTLVDGTMELKKAIIAKFERENGLKYAPEQITVGKAVSRCCSMRCWLPSTRVMK